MLGESWKDHGDRDPEPHGYLIQPVSHAHPDKQPQPWLRAASVLSSYRWAPQRVHEDQMPLYTQETRDMQLHAYRELPWPSVSQGRSDFKYLVPISIRGREWDFELGCPASDCQDFLSVCADGFIPETRTRKRTPLSAASLSSWGLLGSQTSLQPVLT